MEGLMLATYIVRERMEKHTRGSHPTDVGGLPFSRSGLLSLGGSIGAIGIVATALSFFAR